MLLRLSAFALALAMMAVPVAATMCQAVCASDDAQAMRGHEHHHACQASAPAGVAITAVPHSCLQVSRDTVGIEQGLQSADSPLSVLEHLSSLRPNGPDHFVPANGLLHGPPGTHALITQLRV